MQIFGGVMYGLLMVMAVALNDTSINVKIALIVLFLLAAGDMILRGVHTLKMTKENPGYVDDIPEIDRDERGREMLRFAAYTSLLVSYFLGLIAGLVLVFLDLEQAGIAVMVFVCIQQMIFDIFRICEEKLN
ncbi:MAG: hypothetical protein PUI48_01350 [Oscillospiraceae bacterium]|nr:hypothetical protein [Oscillospiraceae bacterium]MDY6209066.1 hypothetical protein [Oscillospiraceae bacterium]